jgi:hypothetical protein
MKQLPNWVLTNPLPSVYDRESVTAIEMVAKLYGAMQELIDELNKCEKEISGFMAEETENRTDFEMEITKVMRQFICKMEGTLQQIDSIVETKLEEVDQAVTDAVNSAIASGAISIMQSYNPETEEMTIAASGNA